jgi:hypothetical protein
MGLFLCMCMLDGGFDGRLVETGMRDVDVERVVMDDAPHLLVLPIVIIC